MPNFPANMPNLPANMTPPLAMSLPANMTPPPAVSLGDYLEQRRKQVQAELQTIIQLQTQLAGATQQLLSQTGMSQGLTQQQLQTEVEDVNRKQVDLDSIFIIRDMLDGSVLVQDVSLLI